MQPMCAESTPMQPTLSGPEVARVLDNTFKPIPVTTTHEKRVAVIVTHGMGQQVPYETIEGVAKAVCTQAGYSVGQPVLRFVRLGTTGRDEAESELVRAEIEVPSPQSNKTFHTHIYECYWAPITAGKVNLTDVISFLLDSGWNGLWNSQARVCLRWMFGKLQKFELKPLLLVITFLLALLLVLSLIAMNTVVSVALASHALGGSGTFPGTLLGAFTADFIVAEAGALLIGLVTAVFPWLFRKSVSPRPLPVWLVWLSWLLVGVSTFGILCGGLFIPLQASGLHPENLLWPWLASLAAELAKGRLWVTVIWAVEVGATFVARWFLVEYVGDVVAYISAHTVSKFWDVRQAIWKAAMRVARAVYSARTADDGARTADDAGFLYDKIIVVGHSLGSVISYDLLNGLLLEDGFSAHPLNVAERTRMLLTFGSPLDKTAFLYRTQKDQTSMVREVGAAAVQPMIADYRNRPREWINLWSRADIISGSLEYYDPPDGKNGEPKRVINHLDPDARTPLAAHTEYWNGRLFAEQLVRGVTS
jgi:hypothetical protein